MTPAVTSPAGVVRTVALQQLSDRCSAAIGRLSRFDLARVLMNTGRGLVRLGAGTFGLLRPV